MIRSDQKVVTRGRVKGLLVGINYRGTSNQLGGCINDAQAMKKLITSSYPDAILELMTDDTREQPTRDNILRKLKQLVVDAVAGDILIFDYSGHGSQVPDIHGDEEDGLDETICPIDFMKKRMINYKGRRLVVDSQITDDEINEIISDVPHGAKFLMLADSCHSGTIGDLKNDFMHYQGPGIWPDESGSANVSSTSTSSATTLASPIAVSLPLAATSGSSYGHSSALSIIKTAASWIYVKLYNREELWLTPLNGLLYAEFGKKKYILPVVQNKSLLGRLCDFPNKSQVCITDFKKISNGQYEVSSPELGVQNIIVDLSSTKAVVNYINIYNSQIGMLPQLQSEMNQELGKTDNSATQAVKPNWLHWLYNKDPSDPCLVNSHYNPVTGKHYHFHRITGKKRTLNMRSLNCNGGELRIISGCREDETSADTGYNGACTMAFLDTVKLYGGLANFLDKIFSHNTQDFHAVEDSINKFLSRFGFTQHSVISWDHSHSNRAFLEDSNKNKIYAYRIT